MEKYINSFLASVMSDGRSKCTVDAYRCDLEQFSEFMKKPLADIKHADLQGWVNHMTTGEFSASSRARKISSVKSFFTYLLWNDIIDRNPAEKLKAPKIEKKVPKALTEKNASDILFVARNSGDRENTWFRDYAIMAVFLFTGIRREELTNIALDDIDLDRRRILIHGKGAKQRTVYINDMLHSILSEYIKAHRKFLKPAAISRYLFPSSQAEKLCLKAVNNIVNRQLEKAGLKEEGISAHILRKTCATEMFNKTHDIATVSKIMGHSSTEVTKRYVIIDEDCMRNAANCVNF